jgi:hypothetical protein
VMVSVPVSSSVGECVNVLLMELVVVDDALADSVVLSVQLLEPVSDCVALSVTLNVTE